MFKFALLWMYGVIFKSLILKSTLMLFFTKFPFSIAKRFKQMTNTGGSAQILDDRSVLCGFLQVGQFHL